jgi:hypothetical protein
MRMSGLRRAAYLHFLSVIVQPRTIDMQAKSPRTAWQKIAALVAVTVSTVA